MKNRQIGSAAFAPITFGCMAVADPGVWGPQNEKETIDAMHAAWRVTADIENRRIH